MRIALLMTGNELLSGDTIDTNSAYIARKLIESGLEIQECVTVGDNKSILAGQIDRLASHYDLVLMNGGLGPTQDDLTAEMLAQAAAVNLECNKDAEAHIKQWCLDKGFKANQANLKQAWLPETATIFHDAPGSACAFYLAVKNCLFIATPGVPSEMKLILQRDILPFLSQQFSLAAYTPWHRLHLLGIGESRLQRILHEEFPHIDKYLEIGFRANFPFLEFKYRPHANAVGNNACIDELEKQLTPYCVARNSANLVENTIEILRQHGLQFTAAESCTGGLIASEMTRVAGASDVFPGSIVSYSNEIKQSLLKVPETVLESAGAVSQECVMHMLEGVLAIMQADVGVAISGIAGPSGGSAEKPTGTVWLAWGDKNKQHSCCLHVPLPRTMFQELLANIAIDLVRRFIEEPDIAPDYLERWKQ